MNEIADIIRTLRPDVDACDEYVSLGDVLDSLDIVMLVTEIYDRLGIRIPAEEIVPQNFSSLHAISDMVERLGGE